MPITQDIVNALPVPEFVEQIAYEQERDNIVAGLQTDVPNFQALPDDILLKMVENTANARHALIELINRSGRGYFLLYATGDRLRARGVEYGLTQRSGESDDSFRLRIFNRLEEFSPSSDAGILALPKSHPSLAIVDTSIDKTALQAPVLYAARADGALLNATDLAALQVWMRDPMRSGPGWVTTVGTATRDSYTISATVSYDARYTDRTLLESRIRVAAYAYIDAHTRLNTPINRAAIYDALFIPDATIDIDPLTAPAADIPAAPASIPVCDKSPSGVILTFADASP